MNSLVEDTTRTEEDQDRDDDGDNDDDGDGDNDDEDGEDMDEEVTDEVMEEDSVEEDGVWFMHTHILFGVATVFLYPALYAQVDRVLALHGLKFKGNLQSLGLIPLTDFPHIAAVVCYMFKLFTRKTQDYESNRQFFIRHKIITTTWGFAASHAWPHIEHGGYPNQCPKAKASRCNHSL